LYLRLKDVCEFLFLLRNHEWNEIILMWRWKVFAMWFEVSLLKHGNGDPFCALNGFLYLVVSRCGWRLNNVIFHNDWSCSCCVSGFDRWDVSIVATREHVIALQSISALPGLTSGQLEIFPFDKSVVLTTEMQ
jgi:hypothetical protein